MDVTLFTNLLGAIGLGSASGLNAWIPLLGLGIAERVGLVTLTQPFDRLGSNAALAVFGALFVVDLIGDKIAVVDHVLHALGTVVAPVSGAVVFAAQENLLSQSHPWAAAAAGMILGESMQVARGLVRPAVTAGTAGVGNPFVSFMEDVVSAMLTVLAIIVPVLAFVFLAVIVFLATRTVLRWRRRRAARVAEARGWAGPAPGSGPSGGPPRGPRAVP